MDSSLDVTIAKKQIGPDVEAAIGDTSCGRCSPWFPAKIAALGNVMGGRKLARYVLAVVGRWADAADTVYHFSARNVNHAFNSRLCRAVAHLGAERCLHRLGGCASGDYPHPCAEK